MDKISCRYLTRRYSEGDTAGSLYGYGAAEEWLNMDVGTPTRFTGRVFTNGANKHRVWCGFCQFVKPGRGMRICWGRHLGLAAQVHGHSSVRTRMPCN